MTNGNKREMLLRLAFTLLLFDLLGKGVHGQCSTPPINLAVYEGTLDTLMICNRQVKAVWQFISTSDELTTITITNSSDSVNPSYAGLYGANQTGLTIKNATTTPGTNPMATAGWYMIKNTTSVRRGAKLLVVREGPTCTCNAINSTSNSTSNSTTLLQLSCSIKYADSSFHPIKAVMNWTSNDDFYTWETPTRSRVDTYWFVSTSTITVDADVPADYQCIVTFAKPTNIQYAWVATNAPAFTASCNSPCNNGETTTWPESTTEPPTTTWPIHMTTTTRPKSTTSTTTTTTTTKTTTTQPTTTTWPIPTTTTTWPSSTTEPSTTTRPTSTTTLSSTITTLPSTTECHCPSCPTCPSPTSMTYPPTTTWPKSTTTWPTFTTKSSTTLRSTITTMPLTTECNCPSCPTCPPLSCTKDGNCWSDGANLTEIYDECVVKAQLYAKCDSCCPDALLCGVVVTLRNESRWLIHDPVCDDGKCEMTAVDASCMSSDWKLLSEKKIIVSGVGDYVEAGYVVDANVTDCSESCWRMMNLP